MSISSDLLQQILSEADHPLGIKELLRLAGLHPGQQTELKRSLRELVRQGQAVKEGKRFLRPGPPPDGGPPVPPPVVPEVAAVHADPRPRHERARPQDPPTRERLTGHGARGQEGGFKGRAPDARGARDSGRTDGGRGRERRDFNKQGSSRREEGRERFGHRGPRRPAFGEVLDTVEGVLHVHRDGFGFVHPVGGEGENIFLPPAEAQRALDNDRVVVEVAGRPGRYEGRLVRVVDRRRELAVGVYTTQGRHALVLPTDTSLPGPIRVPQTQMAQEGDLVKVRLGVGANLLEPGRGLFGEVAGSLGKPGTPSSEVIGIAYSQGFSDEFPPEVMDEADRYAVTVSAEEASGEERKDLRSMQLVTIDGEDARDFDDAVYVEDLAGGWRLVVAIADVTHYVRERSALDAEALRRATSVYLPDRVLPMLPERLSNGICSLKPDEDRMCMVADMTFDAQGQRRSSTLYPAVMRSAARCTYNEVQDVLDGKSVPHRDAFKPHFEKMMSLARALMKMRKERGAIDFDIPEHKVVLGKDGLPERMDKRERKDSHRLIEECMLAANEAVARFFQDEGLPTVYRFHGEPDPEKLAAFGALAQAYGFKLQIDDGVSSKELDAFISQLAGHPEQRALNQLLLRSMMQAVYTPSKVGHYGLAAEHYLHFTSPIRRYPDLLVHRLLKAHWARQGRKPSLAMLDREEEKLEDMAMQCSDRERAAMQVEREVVSFYATLMMKDRVGEEFAATVAAITDFGFFVELDAEHVEGLVKAETLGPGSKLDKQTHSLVYPNGRRVRVGQKLRVRLLSANPTARKIDFDALQFEGEAPLTRHEGGAAARRRPEAREQQLPYGKPKPGNPGQWERDTSKGAPARSWAAREEPSRPRGRFVREGRREEAAVPSRGEPTFKKPWKDDAAKTQSGPRSAGDAQGPKRRMFVRPEQGAGSDVSSVPVQEAQEVREEVVPEVPATPTWSEPDASEIAGSSPHPGFDRLRALASQGQPPKKGGRPSQPQSRHGHGGHGGKPSSKDSRFNRPASVIVPPKPPAEVKPEFAPENWQPSVPPEPPAKPPVREQLEPVARSTPEVVAARTVEVPSKPPERLPTPAETVIAPPAAQSPVARPAVVSTQSGPESVTSAPEKAPARVKRAAAVKRGVATATSSAASTKAASKVASASRQLSAKPKAMSDATSASRTPSAKPKAAPRVASGTSTAKPKAVGKKSPTLTPAKPSRAKSPKAQPPKTKASNAKSPKTKASTTQVAKAKAPKVSASKSQAKALKAKPVKATASKAKSPASQAKRPAKASKSSTSAGKGKGRAKR
ncbi:ribonuclease R [Myxococcus sp. AM011]|uniref:ribonuclease R n=1 Tax=Myxococcus sp. AM011 TaxID=2745200 RepID=UPI0015960914|nr:ribonuclease R [Myxococcus sp. AM011]